MFCKTSSTFVIQRPGYAIGRFNVKHSCHIASKIINPNLYRLLFVSQKFFDREMLRWETETANGRNPVRAQLSVAYAKQCRLWFIFFRTTLMTSKCHWFWAQLLSFWNNHLMPLLITKLSHRLSFICNNI